MMRKAELLWEFGLIYKHADHDEASNYNKEIINNPVCGFLTSQNNYIVNNLQNNRAFQIYDKQINNNIAFGERSSAKWISEIKPGLFAVAENNQISLYSGAGELLEVIKLTLNPNFVAKGRNNNLLIVDTKNALVCESSLDGQIVWMASSELGLKEPRSATINNKGNCIIVDDADNWVFEFDIKRQEIVWSFGTRGKGGKEEERLFSPKYAEETEIGVLIADSYNNRVIIVSKENKVIWQYGKLDGSGSEHNYLWRPTCCQWINDKTIVITDSKNNRIIRVNLDKKVLEELGFAIVQRSLLRLPRAVQIFGDDNVLISDTHNNRIVEIKYGTNKMSTCFEDTGLYWPRCVVFHKDFYWIADGQNNRILKINKNKKIIKEIDSFHYCNNKYYLEDPHHIFPTQEGFVVTSTTNGSVFHISEEGKCLKIISEKIDICDPHCSFRDSDGAFVICDTGNSRICILSSDGKVRIIKEFEIPSEKRILRLGHPRFCIEIEKRYYIILDTGSRSLVACSKSGKFLWQIGGLESINVPNSREFYMSGISFLYDPRWIAYRNDKSILIGDTGNNRIIAIKPI